MFKLETQYAREKERLQQKLADLLLVRQDAFYKWQEANNQVMQVLHELAEVEILVRSKPVK